MQKICKIQDSNHIGHFKDLCYRQKNLVFTHHILEGVRFVSNSHGKY